MTIKAVALDLEGTIINIEPIHHQGHILAAADAGLEISFEEALAKLPHMIGGPDELVAREISLLTDGVDELFILNRKRYHYNRLLPTISIQARPGVLAVIKWLQRNNYKITIGSITNVSQAAILLVRSGLGEIVGQENIVLREDVRHIKPEPDVWLETAKRAGVTPREQLVFDDSPSGIIAARAAGSIAIGMPVYNKPVIIKNLIDAGAARVFMDWREINIAALLQNLNKELKEGAT